MIRPHVFETMGTVASLRTSTPASLRLLRRVEEIHVGYDRMFSRYRPDSPASRLARGEAAAGELGPLMAAALERAIRWSAATEGAFTPFAVDGSVDLMGIAKALAMEAAEVELSTAVDGWVLNVGGDLTWRGGGELDDQVIGIADPDVPEGLLCTVPLDAGWTAAATSGTSERGEHIRRVGPRAEFRQATVLAGDVVTADVLATAIVAGGQEVLLEAAARPGVEALAVTFRGERVFTDGLAEHLVEPRRPTRERGRHGRSAA